MSLEIMNALIAGRVNELLPEVKKIDLFSLANKIGDFQYSGYFMKDAGIEHYKLLAYMSSLFADKTIYDIGTHYGNSSVAMSYAKDTKIVSYDIIEMKRLKSLPENVEYRIGDFREDPEVLKSPFIFVDVDPHDGIQEKDFHEFFLEKKYVGIVLWDDINANLEMKVWWDSIDETQVKKVDLSKLGHWSGTGMIVYG